MDSGKRVFSLAGEVNGLVPECEFHCSLDL